MNPAGAFEDTWLSLRAPADAQARDTALLSAFVARVTAAGTVTELGAGTGNLLRATLPRLHGELRWRLVDADSTLLAAAEATLSGPGHRIHPIPPTDLMVVTPLARVRVQRIAMDLAQGFPGGPVGVVAANAWCDLVSQRWLEGFVDWLAEAKAQAVYLALSADGRITLAPPLAEDSAIMTAFAADMERDKGVGSALGFNGWHRAVDALADAGYTVETAQAEWHLGSAHGALTEAWLAGLATAAQQSSRLAPTVSAWLSTRRRQLASGILRARVGHRDILALRAEQAL